MNAQLHFLLTIAITILLVWPIEAIAARSTIVKVGGSGFALGIIKILAESFEKKHPDVHIRTVPSLGSAGGIKALLAGRVDIALSSRPFSFPLAPYLRHCSRRRAVAADRADHLFRHSHPPVPGFDPG